MINFTTSVERVEPDEETESYNELLDSLNWEIKEARCATCGSFFSLHLMDWHNPDLFKGPYCRHTSLLFIPVNKDSDSFYRNLNRFAELLSNAEGEYRHVYALAIIKCAQLIGKDKKVCDDYD